MWRYLDTPGQACVAPPVACLNAPTSVCLQKKLGYTYLTMVSCISLIRLNNIQICSRQKRRIKNPFINSSRCLTETKYGSSLWSAPRGDSGHFYAYSRSSATEQPSGFKCKSEPHLYALTSTENRLPATTGNYTRPSVTSQLGCLIHLTKSSLSAFHY